MAEIRHACEGGLTAGCFAAYPQFAKKVFAYRLMHTLCPARMTKKLRESLWRSLVRFPISWIPFESFIFPPGFNTKLLFPPGWEPGDPLPPWIVLDPGASFPPDWRPGDPLPRGVTVDLTVLLSPDWTPGDPLPYGITVDPEYRIQIPQLKLMYIYIEPGKTWEQVFPNGWDPTGPLPEGSSWNPYLVFPGYIPAADPSVEPLTPEQEQEAVYRSTGTRPPIKAWTPAQRRRGFAAQDGTSPPLYMGPWEPGPVHREFGGAAPAAGPWFHDAFDTLDWTVWLDKDTDNGVSSAAGGWLISDATIDPGIAQIQRGVDPTAPKNFRLEYRVKIVSHANTTGHAFYGLNDIARVYIHLTDKVFTYDNDVEVEKTVANFIGKTIDVVAVVKDGILNIWWDGALLFENIIPSSSGEYGGIMQLYTSALGETHTDYFTIYEE